MTMFENTHQYTAPSDLFKLQHDLDRAFDTQDLVKVLFEALQERLDICGIRYDHPEIHIHIEYGTSAAHSCEYSLKQDRQQFGKITTLQRHRLSEISLTRLETILGMFMLPLQDSLLYQQAMTHSHWDPVTRVNNKTAFKRALSTLRNNRRDKDHKLNAAFLHLTNLREIYQLYGSEASDSMLCHLLDQLRSHCRPEDQIFRFSDDEFVILLADTEIDEAQHVAMRLGDICRSHQEHFHGIEIQCRIDVEMVECGKNVPCDDCSHSEQQHCLNQASNLHGAA